jgi:hypothetical protein
MSERRRCPACKETKQLADFPRNRATKSGHAAYCKPCHNRISRANDHKTKRLRGILCFNCNRALGKFHDDPELLRHALTYLKRNRKATA